MARERREWTTIRVLKGRQQWLEAMAKSARKPVSDVAEEIFGLYEQAQATGGF